MANGCPYHPRACAKGKQEIDDQAAIGIREMKITNRRIVVEKRLTHGGQSTMLCDTK
jgi:hypothetical protein